MYAITVARTATLCKSSKARESVCVSVFVCVCAFVCVCICVRVRVQHKNRAKQGAANARDLGECRVVSAVLVVCKGRAGAENGAPAQRGALQRESRQASQRVRKGRDEGEGGRRLSPPPTHTQTHARTHARTLKKKAAILKMSTSTCATATMSKSNSTQEHKNSKHGKELSIIGMHHGCLQQLHATHRLAMADPCMATSICATLQAPACNQTKKTKA